MYAREALPYAFEKKCRKPIHISLFRGKPVFLRPPAGGRSLSPYKLAGTCRSCDSHASPALGILALLRVEPVRDRGVVVTVVRRGWPRRGPP